MQPWISDGRTGASAGRMPETNIMEATGERKTERRTMMHKAIEKVESYKEKTIRTALDKAMVAREEASAVSTTQDMTATTTK